MKAFPATKPGACDCCGLVWWPGDKRFELMGQDLCAECAGEDDFDGPHRHTRDLAVPDARLHG